MTAAVRELLGTIAQVSVGAWPIIYNLMGQLQEYFVVKKVIDLIIDFLRARGTAPVNRPIVT